MKLGLWRGIKEEASTKEDSKQTIFKEGEKTKKPNSNGSYKTHFLNTIDYKDKKVGEIKLR